MAIQQKTLSDRTVSALRTANDTVNWDRDLPGFGVRVYPSWSKVCIVQTRAKGKSKHVTVGRHGVIAAEQARQRAAQIITRVKAGKVPVPAPMAPKPPTGPTVSSTVSPTCRRPVCKNSCPGTGWPTGNRPWPHYLRPLAARQLPTTTPPARRRSPKSWRMQHTGGAALTGGVPTRWRECTGTWRVRCSRAAFWDCCSARGLRADRHDKLLKLFDTGGQNCTPNDSQRA